MAGLKKLEFQLALFDKKFSNLPYPKQALFYFWSRMPIAQVKMKNYLFGRKIYLSQTTIQHSFQASPGQGQRDKRCRCPPLTTSPSTPNCKSEWIAWEIFGRLINNYAWCLSTVMLLLRHMIVQLTGSDSSNSQCWSLLSDCTVVHLQLFLARTAHLLWTLNLQTRETS